MIPLLDGVLGILQGFGALLGTLSLVLTIGILVDEDIDAGPRAGVLAFWRGFLSL